MRLDSPYLNRSNGCHAIVTVCRHPWPACAARSCRGDTLRSRFLPEPIEIRLVAGRYWPRHDAWAVVRMQFHDALFDLFEQRGATLGNQHDFGGCLYLALPAIDRVHAGNDVDARGEPFPDQGASNLVGHIEGRGGDIDGQVLAHEKIAL